MCLILFAALLLLSPDRHSFENYAWLLHACKGSWVTPFLWKMHSYESWVAYLFFFIIAIDLKMTLCICTIRLDFHKLAQVGWVNLHLCWLWLNLWLDLSFYSYCIPLCKLFVTIGKKKGLDYSLPKHLQFLIIIFLWQLWIEIFNKLNWEPWWFK